MAKKHNERWYGYFLSGEVLGNAGYYCGIRGVHFLDWGASDPELRYKDHIINSVDLEDYFYPEFEEFMEDNPDDFRGLDYKEINAEFEKYLRDRAWDVKNFILEYGTTGDNFGERELAHCDFDRADRLMTRFYTALALELRED